MLAASSLLAELSADAGHDTRRPVVALVTLGQRNGVDRALTRA
jgi:hypothetical protein